jgi:hypothetical protein
MDPEKHILAQELVDSGKGAMQRIPISVMNEQPSRYPFPSGRRCVNIIPKEEGWQTCGNPINRYSEFEVCNVCRTEARGMVIETLLRLRRQRGNRY